MMILNENLAVEFSEFDLHSTVLEGISAMSFKEATAIQEKALPIILKENDLLASAQTGTGKTGAFLIPILSLIKKENSDGFSTLILVPTRELAKQIDEQIEGLGYFVGVNSIAIYGGGKGEDWEQQRAALTQGANIIIATPGRLMAHMNSGKVKFDKVKRLVLDEADKMLDMGFLDDIMFVLKHLPEKRQSLMFSATMPPKIRTLARKILKDPEEISLAVSKPADKIEQSFFLASDEQKLDLLVHLIQPFHSQNVIIFTSQKNMVSKIVKKLEKRKIQAMGVSSDIVQEEREEALRSFKAGKFNVLVATDVLSRGIDISNLNLVINFDMPRDAEDYIHRIGRTARAEAEGTAFTFINSRDAKPLRALENLLEYKIELKKITEELGLGPAPEMEIFKPKPKRYFKPKFSKPKKK